MSNTPMPDSKRRQVRADHVHQGVDGEAANLRQPVRLGPVEPLSAIPRRQGLADILQIVAGIVSGGNFADDLAQRLPVAQVGRARERVDLRPGIVDVEFARYRESRAWP